jgi:hypothetical protein
MDIFESMGGDEFETLGFVATPFVEGAEKPRPACCVENAEAGAEAVPKGAEGELNDEGFEKLPADAMPNVAEGVLAETDENPVFACAPNGFGFGAADPSLVCAAGLLLPSDVELGKANGFGFGDTELEGVPKALVDGFPNIFETPLFEAAEDAPKTFAF